MFMNLTIFRQKNIFLYIILIATIILDIVISLNNSTAFPIILILAILLFVKPTWLFYLFMLFFVFGEIDMGQLFIQLSLSNGFAVIALLSIVLYGLFGKRANSLIQTSQQKRLLLVLFTLFIVEIISSVLSNSFRPLTTRFSHIISVLFVFLVVRDKRILWRGFFLGIVSIGILSLLTILAGFNLNKFGFRSPYNWGSTPWEAYIPRSIGLPNMGGGLHAIYILAFLPLAILIATSRNNFLSNWWVKPASSLIAILGVFAILIASYRSGWLGLMVSLFCLIWFRYKTSHLLASHKIIVLVFIIGFVVLILFLFGNPLYNYLYVLIFSIRSQGIDARFIQTQFILEQVLLPSINLFFGYGYDRFGSGFMGYIAQQGLNNPELYPWIHNYYLGLLYASGWIGFILFFVLVFNVMKNIYRQFISTNDSNTRIINSAIFSSLAGIFTVLGFTAETSGLHIIWILIAVSALNNKNGSNFITHYK